MTVAIVYGFKYKNSYFFYEVCGHTYLSLPIINNSYAINRAKELFRLFTLNEIKEHLNKILSKCETIIPYRPIQFCDFSTEIIKSNPMYNRIQFESEMISSTNRILQNHKLFMKKDTNKVCYDEVIKLCDIHFERNQKQYEHSSEEEKENNVKYYQSIKKEPEIYIHLQKFQDIFCKCSIVQFEKDKSTELWVDNICYVKNKLLNECSNVNSFSACIFIDLDDMILKCYKCKQNRESHIDPYETSFGYDFPMPINEYENQTYNLYL